MNQQTEHPLVKKLKGYFQSIDNLSEQAHPDGTSMKSMLEDLFAANAVYNRGAINEASINTLQGIDKIVDYYSEKRQLIGEHKLDHWEAFQGIPNAVADAFKQARPEVDAANLTTVLVKGSFSGASYRGKKGMHLDSVHDANITFDDYWVFDEHEKCIYRHSNISPKQPSRVR